MQRFVPVEALFKGRHFDGQIIILCVSSNASGAGRVPAGIACGRSCNTNWSRFVPVAEALSRLVPNSDSRLILLIRHAQAAMPVVNGCRKQDYAVLIVVGLPATH